MSYTPAQQAWLEFVNTMRALLVPRADDRPLDQYLALRDNAIRLAQSPAFLEDIQNTWGALTNVPVGPEIADALLLELQALPRAAEVARATDNADSGTVVSRLLSRASTTLDSIKEFANMTPLGKGVLTLLKEVVDLFKG